MYRVLRNFRDLKDRQYLYRAGDEYPRAGQTASSARIEALMTGKNKAKLIFIEEIPEEKPVEKKPAKKKTTKKTTAKKKAAEE